MTAKELFEKHATRKVDLGDATFNCLLPFLQEHQFMEALADIMCGQVEAEAGESGLLPCRDEIIRLHKAWKEWLELPDHIPSEDMLESMGRLFKYAGIDEQDNRRYKT